MVLGPLGGRRRLISCGSRLSWDSADGRPCCLRPDRRRCAKAQPRIGGANGGTARGAGTDASSRQPEPTPPKSDRPIRNSCGRLRRCRTGGYGPSRRARAPGAARVSSRGRASAGAERRSKQGDLLTLIELEHAAGPAFRLTRRTTTRDGLVQVVHAVYVEAGSTIWLLNWIVPPSDAPDRLDELFLMVTASFRVE